MADVRSQVDWSKRSAEFGPLEVVETAAGELVAMPLKTPGIDDPDLDWGLWTTWLDLPPHPRIFEALEHKEGALLLRYAAIDWTWQPGTIEGERTTRFVATWGIELTRAFDFASACIDEAELGWLTCPFAKLDIVGDPRVGFFNPAGNALLMRRVAPEVLASFPRADARALVFAVGQLLLNLVELRGKASQTPLGHVILRCLAPDPAARFQTLKELRGALGIVGGRVRSISPYDNPIGWDLAQQAIGYALLDRPQRAASLMRQAKHGKLAAAFGIELTTGIDVADYEERIRRAQASRKAGDAAAALNELVAEAEIPPTTKRTRSWKAVRGTAQMHVQAGRYRDALALFDTSELADDDASEILLGTAECHLFARDYGAAVDFAEQTLARDPKAVQAYAILAEARLRRRELPRALEAVQQWAQAKPDDGHAHYVAAKILLALGRFAEARDACDRALELAPKHLPAMMLRRQIERSIQRVRAVAGHAAPAPVDLPAHLRVLRPLLLAGKTTEAIAALEAPAYAGDEVAKLLRADLLAFTEQLEAAETAYAELSGVAAGVGRVLVLVKLGKSTDALAVCDALIKEHANTAEAHEARALALQQLGRGSEADEELRRAAAADRQRSQMRVKLAKP